MGGVSLVSENLDIEVQQLNLKGERRVCVISSLGIMIINSVNVN